MKEEFPSWMEELDSGLCYELYFYDHLAMILLMKLEVHDHCHLR
jgi:hypothetical protein